MKRKKKNAPDPSECCVRCGVDGEGDLRTLWMACLYAMHEMKDVPFRQVLLRGATLHEHTGEKPTEWGFNTPMWSEQGEPTRDHPLYTLRVCKKCRSEWMSAIERWFKEVPVESPSCGSGIFVRKYGQCVEITEEEWRERRKSSNPV